MTEIINGGEVDRPTAHAGSHTDGSDDIRNATNAQKGLATAAQITALEAALGPTTLPGLVIRPKFAWKDADEIYVGGGVYHHQGTSEQFVYWNSQLTIQLSGAGADDWYYLYLDDSGIVTLGSNLLTAAEFVWSTTEPTFDEAKKGQYNGLDRCIFAVLTDGSNNILEFHNEADLVLYGDRIIELDDVDIDTAWTDVILTAPKFTTKILTMIHEYYSGGDSRYISYRPNGQASSTGHFVGTGNTNNDYTTNTFGLISDSDQIIEVKHNGSGANEIRVDTDGWFFPAGM